MRTKEKAKPGGAGFEITQKPRCDWKLRPFPSRASWCFCHCSNSMWLWNLSSNSQIYFSQYKINPGIGLGSNLSSKVTFLKKHCFNDLKHHEASPLHHHEAINLPKYFSWQLPFFCRTHDLILCCTAIHLFRQL